jgi:hypothetical protein
LEPTTKTSLDFDLPIAATRVPVSMQLPPRRTDAVEINNGGYELTIAHLPKTLLRHTLSRFRLDQNHSLSLIDSVTGSGSTVKAAARLPPPSVELLVISQAPEHFK